MRTDSEYKQLTIKEFTKAAEIYESDHAGIYEMCKDDYPYIASELGKEDYQGYLKAEEEKQGKCEEYDMELTFGDVQETALIPLAIKASETARPNARITDIKAKEIIDALGVDVSKYDPFCPTKV